MSLKEDLAALRARLEGNRSPDVVKTMHRAIDELREAGPAARILKSGQRAPAFVLPNAAEELVESRRLLAQGPLVVTFYRGRW
jgi:hypothetical protein